MRRSQGKESKGTGEEMEIGEEGNEGEEGVRRDRREESKGAGEEGVWREASQTTPLGNTQRMSYSHVNSLEECISKQPSGMPL